MANYTKKTTRVELEGDRHAGMNSQYSKYSGPDKNDIFTNFWYKNEAHLES